MSDFNPYNPLASHSEYAVLPINHSPEKRDMNGVCFRDETHLYLSLYGPNLAVSLGVSQFAHLFCCATELSKNLLII